MRPRCANLAGGCLSAFLACLNSLATVLAVAACGVAAPGPQPRGLLVHAAASLTDVLPQAVGAEPTRFDFGSTARLARQIEAGVPGDVFVAADRAWMDYLDRLGALVPNTRVLLASNALVMVVPVGSTGPTSPAALLADANSTVAVADTAVPAGRYAEAALRHAGVWDVLNLRPGGVVRADDVRATLAWVVRAEVDAAIVYATDAAAESRVETTHVFSPASHPPVEYWAAVLASTQDDPRARALVHRLASNPTIWRDAGFTGVP